MPQGLARAAHQTMQRHRARGFGGAAEVAPPVAVGTETWLVGWLPETMVRQVRLCSFAFVDDEI